MDNNQNNPNKGAGKAGRKQTAEDHEFLRSPAGAATLKLRHKILILSFGLWVILPLLISAFYLYAIADDQYASEVGFSVRKEEASSAIEVLGGITELSGSSSSDTDILYEFIQSQQMVRKINARLSLPEIYQISGDPVFSLGDDIRIEALYNYWSWMVKVYYDRGSGLIQVRVLAFDPNDAQNIAQVIYDESSKMINQLSAIAREDATRNAREELTRTEDQLRGARTALTAFRTRTQIVDPAADVQGQMGLLASLQAKLAEAIIEREILLDSASENDPRVKEVNKKIEVIREQIAQERGEFTGRTGDEETFTRQLEEFETLKVDLEFAEKSWSAARAAYDSALAEAQRQSRYLAAHVDPTLAETSEYPRRFMLVALIGGLLFITWVIGAMSYYALRDRR